MPAGSLSGRHLLQEEEANDQAAANPQAPAAEIALADRPVSSNEPAGSPPAVAGGIPALPSMSGDGLGFISSSVPTGVDAVADADGTFHANLANRSATLATLMAGAIEPSSVLNCNRCHRF